MCVTRYTHIIYQFMTSSLFSSHSINLMIEMLVGHLDSQCRWALQLAGLLFIPVTGLLLCSWQCTSLGALEWGQPRSFTSSRFVQALTSAKLEFLSVFFWLNYFTSENVFVNKHDLVKFIWFDLRFLSRCVIQLDWPYLLEWQQGLSIISTKQ